MKKRIAVIGSGISGLVSAALLSERFEVSLFEANSYLGGHTCTVDIEVGNRKQAIDTGFVVFNKQTYPNFCKLIEKNNISIHPSEMSFSYRSHVPSIEYNGHNLNTLFADRRNFFRPAFYRFIKDILTFNKDAKEFLTKSNPDDTIADFASRKKYNELFLKAYLIPVIASIWSKSVKDVLNCPADFLLQFFLDHGLLSINDRPQWYVIAGGSRNYIPSLIKNLADRIYLNTKIEKLERNPHGIVLKIKDGSLKFDAAIVAVHSDQALEMIKKPSEMETAILGAIKYIDNDVILHTDTTLLPKNRLAWASWNYYDVGSDLPTLTYYMNRLQNFTAKENICLSVNLNERIAPEKILHRFIYAHPRFSHEALQAQKKHALINGIKNTYYCGSYWGFGFHEDGVKSALEVGRSFGIEL